MRPPSKRRQFARRFATTISLAIFAIWIYAGFQTNPANLSMPSTLDTTPQFSLFAGCLQGCQFEMQQSNVHIHDHYYVASPSGRFHFRPGLILPRFVVVPGVGRFFLIPLWLPFLLAAIPTALLWRRDRRPGPGHCPHCNYNMTGNESNKCPECGTPAPKSVPAAPKSEPEP